jgi:hypothetical protein
MPDNQQFNSMGEPAPVEGGSAWETLGRFAGIAIAAAGGVTIFAILTTPTHVQGATASLRIQWRHQPACEASGQIEPSAEQTAADSSTEHLPAK